MSLQLHYTGQDYNNRGLLQGANLVPGSTSSISNSCKTGNGFVFDGTVNSHLSVLMPSEPIAHSFSCWFRITDIAKTRFIASFGQQHFLQFMLWQRTNGEFVFGYTGVDGVQVNVVLISNLPRDVWYHFTAAIDGRIMRLYLNGVLLQTHTASQDVRKGSDKTIRLGQGTTSDYLLGQVCNFKYYDHALSMKEIREDYKSLVLHYPLNNEITDKVHDCSGFKNDGVVIKNELSLSSNTNKYRHSSEFNDVRIQIPAILGNIIRRDYSFSIAHYIYFNSYTLSESFAMQPQSGRMIFRANGQLQYYLGVTSGNEFVSTNIGAIEQDNWYHVCVTYDGDRTWSLYVNGVLAQSREITGTMTDTYSNRMLIGGESTTARPIFADMNDFRIYATELTAADVVELYNTRHELDKNGNFYCGEVVEIESGNVDMKRNSILNTIEVNEVDFDTSSEILTDEIRINNIKEI